MRESCVHHFLFFNWLLIFELSQIKIFIVFLFFVFCLLLKILAKIQPEPTGTVLLLFVFCIHNSLSNLIIDAVKTSFTCERKKKNTVNSGTYSK